MHGLGHSPGGTPISDHTASPTPLPRENTCKISLIGANQSIVEHFRIHSGEQLSSQSG